MDHTELVELLRIELDAMKYFNESKTGWVCIYSLENHDRKQIWNGIPSLNYRECIHGDIDRDEIGVYSIKNPKLN